MQKLKQIIEYLSYSLLILLPFQTRFIYHLGNLNGPWEYGTFSLYATEILLGIVMLLAIIYFLVQIKKNKPKLKNKITPLILTAIFFIIIVFNIIFAIDSQLAYYKFVQLLLGISFSLILINFGELKKTSWFFLISGTIQSALAIYQFVEQKVFASKWLGMAGQSPSTLGVPIIETNERVLRAFGSLPHPNILGGFLVLVLIICVQFYFSEKIFRFKKLLVPIFELNLIGLLFTFSRSAWLALIISLLTIFIFYWQYKKEILVKFILQAILIISIFTISYSNLIFARFNLENRVEKISTEARINQYSQFKNIFKEYWLSGTGIGNYTLALHKQNPSLNNFDLQPIHNTLFLIIAEFGIPLAVLLFFLKLLILNKIFNRKYLPFFLPIFSSLLVVALLDHYVWSFYFGILFSFTAFAFCTLLLKFHNK